MSLIQRLSIYFKEGCEWVKMFFIALDAQFYPRQKFLWEEEFKEKALSDSVLDKTWIQSGSLPNGCILEVKGDYSTGKTALSFFWIAQMQKQMQKQNKPCAYLTSEIDIDPGFAQTLGVEVNELLCVQMTNGQQVLELAKELILTGKISFIVLDALNTESFSSPLSSSHIHPLFMLARQYNCTLLFCFPTNHASFYQELRFYADIRILLTSLIPLRSMPSSAPSYACDEKDSDFLLQAQLLKINSLHINEPFTLTLKRLFAQRVP